MKAMILAAGRGERLRPLTDHTPKPLIKVQGKSLIEYHIEKLSTAGFKEIIINIAWLGEKIKHQLNDGAHWGVKITYSEEKTALETAGGIIKALPLLCKNNDQFLIVNADIYTHYDFSHLSTLRLKNALAHLVMVTNPSYHSGDFFYHQGKLYTSQQDNRESLTYAGIGIYHKELFAKLKTGKQPLAPLLREGIAKNIIDAEKYSGLWTDVGTQERLNSLNLI